MPCLRKVTIAAVNEWGVTPAAKQVKAMTAGSEGSN